MTEMTMVAAVNAGLRAALRDDPKVLLMGEDIGALGGVFRVTDGLLREFGELRVVDTPLAESTILGTAVGLAFRGYRPVVEIQFEGFMFPAFDQLVTQVAKLRMRSEGAVAMPIVVRMPYGGGIGAVEHHSESPEAYFAHTPGLRVITPSSPADAFLMTRQAIASEDPVIVLEPKRRYWDKGEVDLDADLAEAPSPWRAHVVRSGRDLTLACYGPMVRTCLEAAEIAAQEGRSIEVVDLRSLSPLDFPTLVASVERTSRLVVVSEAQQMASVASEVAATVAERCYWTMEAPVLRVCGLHSPYPPNRLEHHYLPGVARVLEAIDRSMEY